MLPARFRYVSLLLGALVFIPAFSAALSVPLGDEIPLTGTSTGSQTVYLFLTGPNLPAGGVRLSDGAPVVTGSSSSFTRVDVQTDNTWRYEWDTGGLGGIIDVGSYVVYVVDEPAGREDLAGKEYATVSVSLTEPYLSVVTASPSPAATGTIEIITAPTTMTTQRLTESPATETTMPATGMTVPGLISLIALILVVIITASRRN
jgi:hypothetical protein